ncbi:Hpt domain-containing protein [Paeniglutamicibacter sp. ORCA_105]|uniref:Hpt domain-containing protein n=1 Tax=Paeniglutamicibacter sp. ORCA_105 TaxID=3377336 RepID=UPI0038938EDA
MHTPSTAPIMGLTDTMAGVAREDSPMSTLPSPNGQPLVDLAVLRELEQQVDDPSIVVGFVHDFVDLWESRYERLAQALDPLDPDTALDALISIKTAAAMAGAVRLAGDARELGEVVKRGDEAAAKALLPLLASCGQQTLLQLQEHYPKSKEQG